MKCVFKNWLFMKCLFVKVFVFECVCLCIKANFFPKTSQKALLGLEGGINSRIKKSSSLIPSVVPDVAKQGGQY